MADIEDARRDDMIIPSDELIAALEFYADKANWTAGRWPDEDLDEVVEGMICVDRQEEDGGSVIFADCGDRARAALSARTASDGAVDVAALVARLRGHYEHGIGSDDIEEAAAAVSRLQAETDEIASALTRAILADTEGRP